jgi:tetratricopeptide (TPR) repeat protein
MLAPRTYAVTKEEQEQVYESYALESKGDYAQSIAKMAKVFDENKSDYFINYRMGWLFSMNKKYENSTEHYEKAAQASPKSLEPWLALSSLDMNLGLYAKVIAVSEEILKRDPANYLGLQRFITACIKLQKFEQALPKVNNALAFYPIDAIFLEQKGYLLNQLNKPAEAKKVLGTLLLISPTNAYAKSIFTAK